ncbi:MAG: transporter substrate-binding domain-containing protein [Lachnospiraceae bacterium]|nr:transporter substrate-binding domain-containing protein [Lachnospiraceae bacterium]
MKKLLAMSLIGCMALSMVACGSGETATATTEPAAEETAAEETTEDATEETAAEEPAAEETADDTASADDKVWIIATDTVFRPFEFTDENGDFVGIDVDVLAAIAEDQGFKYELQSLGWDAAVAAVQAGQADGLIAGATIKQERIDSGWIFSDGYYDATQTFVLPEGSDITGYADLAGKNVAVKNGTAGADFANSLKDEYGFTVTVFEDSPTMYQDVILGNSAACVEDTPIMADSIKTGGLALVIPEGMESEGAPYGFAIMNEENQELLDMFNAGLANIKANGKYDEILAKYLGN